MTDEFRTDVTDNEHQALEALGQRFMEAVNAKDRGDIDTAEDIFRTILRVEPRLPEPRLELARLLLDTDRLADAEPHAREAITHLEAGGAWTDELPEHIVKGVAHALLAEILRRIADEDDVIFGDPARFQKLVAESKEHFEKAAALDSDDSYSSYYAFFLGEDGHKPKGTA
jgi:tetratricopeptide (TPR) repeat protein